jgi:hypothetical protein
MQIKTGLFIAIAVSQAGATAGGHREAAAGPPPAAQPSPAACPAISVTGTPVADFAFSMGVYVLQPGNATDGRPAYYDASNGQWLYCSPPTTTYPLSAWFIRTGLGQRNDWVLHARDNAQTPDAITATWEWWDGQIEHPETSVKASCVLTYSCNQTTGTCDADAKGTQTHANCNQTCSATPPPTPTPTPKVRCNTTVGQCVVDPHGPLSPLDCIESCKCVAPHNCGQLNGTVQCGAVLTGCNVCDSCCQTYFHQHSCDGCFAAPVSEQGCGGQ